VRRSGDTLVLCYHAVSPDWPERYTVTPDALETHVRHLLRRGYRGVTFAGAVRAGDGERVFALTFDDAYRSVRERALPLLGRLGVPATVFAVSGFAESAAPVTTALGDWAGGPHEGELQSMGWDELRALTGYGWEIGSHTRSHPMLTRLSDAELRDELAASRAACEEGVGRPCTSLAYPYGDFDARVARAAAAAGYEQAATLFGGQPDRPEPLEWPRVAVNRHHSPPAFRLKSSPLVRRARTRPATIKALELAMRATGRTPAARPSGGGA
jgi:peptidoglycan/xylan/chitin deacetylase (PgdA/CDA1 family)